jgi:catechol 2,3-dioxygenase-like lactoylglutathione lyase family enzyme
MATAQFQHPRTGLAIERLACLVLPVTDTARAQAFYQDHLGLSVLGSDILPNLGAHAVLSTASGQLVALARVGQIPDLSDTGVHHALRVNDPARDKIAANLASADIAIHSYGEDREAEKNDKFFFFDPDGNRLQLVTGTDEGDGVSAIDHTAILAFDMLWAEKFYVELLGLPVEGRVGWKTADHARARIWAAGGEDMAPGTRRLDKLYMTMGGQNEVPRANMQIFLQTGSSMLMLYLATRHFQEPPEGQVFGAPRTIFGVKRDELDRTASLLEEAGQPFEGPVDHASTSPFDASLYVRDPSGNFVELCSVRK